jgi:diguanylate cyclase (GGDEF)-like protein/PAS domain S-box-containing protein
MVEAESHADYDATQRRRTRAERWGLDSAETHFQRLVDRSPDGIAVHQDGRIVYANETAVRWVGAQYADQVRGHLVTEFLHPESLEPTMTRLAALRHDGDATRPSEGVLIRLDGTTLDVEAVTALTTWGGQPAYHVTLRDLTHLRTAHKSLQYQAGLVDQVTEAIIATTVTGLVTKWNRAAESIYRRSAANAMALPVATAVGAPLDLAAIVAQGGVTHATHYAADAEPLIVRVSVAAVASGYVVVCTDQTKTYGTERLLRRIINSLDEGILVIDGVGGVVTANPAAEKILGMRAAVLTGGDGRAVHALTMYDAERRVIPPHDHPFSKTAKTGRPFRGQVIGVDRGDGRRIWLRTSCRRLDGEHHSSTAILVSFSDITAERVAQERLVHRATHDALTGLPNRLAVLNRIAESLRAQGDGRLGAVLFIDVDNLKAINDSLGHDSGDELLKRVGQCLRTSVAAQDVVGRLGGDEFVVLITGDVGSADLGNVVGELERSLAEPMDLGTATVRTQASIGVTAVDPDDERTPIEILRDADAAMYVTKSMRRRRNDRAAASFQPGKTLHRHG